MTFKKLMESPVGIVGRTGQQDAEVHVTPELEKQFMKIVKQLGGKTVARLLLSKMNSKSDKLSKSGDSFLDESKDAEKLLIKNNVKIKQKFGTKFGTEFSLAKKYDENDIKKILKGFNVTFDGNSIFVS